MSTYSNLSRKFRAAMVWESIKVFPPKYIQEDDITSQELDDFTGLYLMGGEL